MKPVAVWPALLFILLAGVPQLEARIRKLPLSAFPELPVKVVEELECRQCRIPQAKKSKRNNVIQGSFSIAGRTDWAVLCATKKYTSLLVFRTGPEPRTDEVMTTRNGYSNWSISVPDSVVLKRPGFDHQGIHTTIEFGDQDTGRAYDYSAEFGVWYCDQGRWTQLEWLIAN
ncbi:MAG: hypothetical protein ABI972_02140 [Acidobacteriota bacterium]